MDKTEVILDASQIEVFEQCPRKWYYDHIMNITSKKTNPNLSTGTFYHEVLKVYYSTGKTPLSNGLRETVEFAMNLAKTTESPEVRKNPKFHLDRLRSYLITNLNEDDQSEVIAVEKGFSTVLYEDAAVRYILEGTIDLVSIEPKLGLTVTDHKTQSRFYDKYQYNHQALNYLAFTGAKYFRYNYIGLQDAQGPNTFRRPIFQPHPGMLEQWKEDVRKTFDQMATYLNSIDPDKFSSEPTFPRRRTACDTKFGVCQFHKICQTPDNSKWIPVVLTAYKEKDKRWKPWA